MMKAVLCSFQTLQHNPRHCAYFGTSSQCLQELVSLSNDNQIVPPKQQTTLPNHGGNGHGSNEGMP